MAILKGEVVSAVPQDIVLREVELADDVTVEKIKDALGGSIECHRVFSVDGTVALWGYCTHQEGCYAWMLGTPRMYDCKVAFARTAHKIFKGLLGLYPFVLVHADNHYADSIRWLGSIGFKTVEPQGRYELMKLERN